jgi:hypothetical protein
MSNQQSLQQRMTSSGADRSLFQLAMDQACEYMDGAAERRVFPGDAAAMPALDEHTLVFAQAGT